MNRLNIKTKFVLAIIFSLLIISCSKNQEEVLPSEPVPISLTADQQLIIESENAFAFDIFKKILETEAPSKNIIISPLSISCALSMTLNGAEGSTRDKMLEALKMSGITPEIINNSYKYLFETLLEVDKRVLISIANSVWIENDFNVKKNFINILTDYYSAESKSFEITDPTAPKQINNWIDINTNGLIKNMITELNENTVMLLINAIYFKGKWTSQFEIKNTSQRSFTKVGGVSSQVPMMKQTSEFKVFTDENFTMAEFPYGQGNYVMDVILPVDPNGGVTGAIPILNSNTFNGWIDRMNLRKTDLTFPRFKYGYKKKLKEILTSAGMGIAFTDNADFSNIADIDLLINDVIHQAFIETNEEGSEAAAVTIVDIFTTSMPPQNLILNIDHPFLYILREKTTNTILFMGRVADPLAE